MISRRSVGEPGRSPRTSTGGVVGNDDDVIIIVIIGDDGENLTMPWEDLEKQQEFHDFFVESILLVGRPLYE